MSEKDRRGGIRNRLNHYLDNREDIRDYGRCSVLETYDCKAPSLNEITHTSVVSQQGAKNSASVGSLLEYYKGLRAGLDKGNTGVTGRS